MREVDEHHGLTDKIAGMPSQNILNPNAAKTLSTLASGDKIPQLRAVPPNLLMKPSHMAPMPG